METWKLIPGLGARYEASSEGRIRRLTPANATRPGRIRKLFEGGGYLRCSFYENGKVFCLSAHRLVFEAFHGPIPEGKQINHLDGDKFNNRIQNLEVCTGSENMLHAYQKLGRKAVNTPRYGEANNKAKLREADLTLIRELHAAGMSQQRIAERFGVYQSTISQFLLGRTWRHVS